MAEPVLTKARQSVWAAIDDWPALQGKFRRVWRFDDAEALLEEPTPSLGDLPALAIYPSYTPLPQWVLNQSQRIPYTLEAKLWTRHWSLLAGERLWEEIVRALFRSGPPGQTSHVFQGTGHNGVDLGPLSVQRQRLDKQGPLCTVWRWSISLQIHWNPSAP